MNTFWANLIQQEVRFLMGFKNWGKVMQTVESLTSSDLSGAEKRALALQELQDIGKEIGSSLLNLALEIAVQKLKNTPK